MRTRSFAVALACAGMLLAGCGTKAPEPKPLETPTASASVSASPTAPALPDVAKEHSKAGAIAFVRHFIAASNNFVTSGDPRAWKPMTQPSCQSCRNLADRIESLYESGGSATGGDLRIKELSLAPGGLTPKTATIDVHGRYAPQVITEDGSAKPNKGGEAFITYLLNWTKSGWLISEYTQADT